MSFPEQVFRAYDIRGVYPDELNEDFAYKLGRSFALFIQENLGREEVEVGVGRDARLSSPSLKNSLVEGLRDQGARVVDMGMLGSPNFYFAVGKYDFDGGIQVSASHNPSQFNGFKMMKKGLKFIGGQDKDGERIKELMKKGEFPNPSVKGEVETKEGIVAEYAEEVLTYIDISKIKPLKVVVDPANSVGGPIIEEIFKHLPCELVKLYFDIDGRFPNHEADPFKEENNRDLQKKVMETKADLGVALDGDGDRVFFIDETAQTINPAILRGITAKIFLREHPGAKICYDIRPGRITKDMIEEAGGVPVLTKVGHSFIKQTMNDVGAVFGGESSGHFYVRTKHGLFDAPEIVLVKFLQELSQSDKTVSEFIAPYKRYFDSGEINFAVDDKQAVFERLKQKYGEALNNEMDGLSFEYENFWFNVRASNTENKVRLNLEGLNKEIVQEKAKEVGEVIVG